MKKDSKIYIAGHRGLVGSAIVKNLESKGYTNLVYRTHKELDLLDTNAVAKFFEEEKLEYVFLAAAKVGGIVANNTYRADFIYENLQIQNNVIYNAYKYNVQKLMFLGSTCIYPKNAPQPMKEEYLLTSELEYTNEPYAIAKIAGIKMCESFNIQYKTNFISVMPTNLYGKNDNFDLEKSHVLPALMRKIHLGKLLESVKWEVLSAKKKDKNWELILQDLNNNPIENIDGNSTKEEILNILDKYGIKLNTTHLALSTSQPQVEIEIWGTGKPRREFLYSEDMADACVFILESRNFVDIVNTQSNPTHNTQHITPVEVRNTHINIGTGIDISIKELALTIKRIVGYEGELYFNDTKPDGTMIKLTNPTKLNDLGWRYKTELEDGIRTMYKWYLNNEKQ